MGKFNYNNKIYDEFGSLDFGKRNYLLIKNENDLKYIYTEMVEGKKVFKMPSNNYNLEANQGKSLKQLNERILVDHILDSFKSDLDNLGEDVERVKGIIVDPRMTMLLKGNLTEITIESFEKNKQDMLNYFDISYGVSKQPVVDDKETIDQTIVMSPLKNDYPELSRMAKYEEPTPSTDTSSELPVEEPVEKNDFFSKLDNPIGVKESELDLNTVDSMLGKKEQLNDEQANYLEGLQNKLSNELEVDKKQELTEKPKTLVKTKKSGFVDVIIVCLGIQLVLFVGLICVMLLTK